jgi:hypothetical protein
VGRNLVQRAKMGYRFAGRMLENEILLQYVRYIVKLSRFQGHGRLTGSSLLSLTGPVSS